LLTGLMQLNIKSFLISLYFRMLKEENLKHFLKDIEEALKVSKITLTM